MKKGVFAIYDIININTDFMIFWTLVIGYSWKNTETQIKLKPNFFLKTADTLVDTCQNSEKRINVWWNLGLKTTYLLDWRILWILNKPRFNNWFKDERDGKISNFCQIS